MNKEPEGLMYRFRENPDGSLEELPLTQGPRGEEVMTNSSKEFDHPHESNIMRMGYCTVCAATLLAPVTVTKLNGEPGLKHPYWVDVNGRYEQFRVDFREAVHKATQARVREVLERLKDKKENRTAAQEAGTQVVDVFFIDAELAKLGEQE